MYGSSRNFGHNRKDQTCRVPVCMRDWCLQKAEEENFLYSNIDFHNKHGGSDSSSPGIPGLDQAYSSNIGKVRRLSTTTMQLPQLITCDARYYPLRSLILFDSQRGSDSSQFLKPLFNCFRLLRVLKFESQGKISVSEGKVKLPKEIGQLVHLRFFSLKDSQVQELPSSICNLVCLQTLDLRTTWVLEFPNVLWKLSELRHLYLRVAYKVRGTRKLRLNDLSKLQSLVNVSTKDFDVHALAELTNLSKLKINLDRNVEEVFTSTSITFSHLQSMYMVITGIKLDEDPPLVKFPDNRQFFPTSLRKLTFAQTFLRADPMAMLERRLPNLRSLRLYENAYMGDQMSCSRGGFPQLRSLCISGLHNWKEWRLEEGALPCLSELKLIYVFKLTEIPDGLRNVTTLRKCVIQWMPKEFVERVLTEDEDFHKLQHASVEISDML